MHVPPTIRQLIRQPGLTTAAALTLGLGIAASLAVFTLVNAVLLRPLPYIDPARIVSLRRVEAVGLNSGTHRDVRFLREYLRTCSPVGAGVGGAGVNTVINGRASRADDRLISAGYFEALGVPATWGRTFTAQEDTPAPELVAMLTERLARRAGRDPSQMIGSEIQIDGWPYTIVGVVADRHLLKFDADVYRPLRNDARGAGSNLDMLCRLNGDSSVASVDAELQTLIPEAQRLRLASDDAARVYQALPRHETQFGYLRQRLLTLLGAVALVLLVSAANTTGLLLVRASARRREIAMRAALGASPRRLARELIGEGLSLAALSGCLGLLVAPLMVRGLLAVAPPLYGQLADFALDFTVIGAALALCTLVGLAVSVPPLIEVLRINLRDTLQDEGPRGTTGRKALWMRQLIIGAETALCAVLLVGALLLVRTFLNLVNEPTGFDATGIVTARMSAMDRQYRDGERLVRLFEEGVARLEQMPSIEGAAVTASLPAERAINLPAKLPDSAKPTEIVVVNWRYVSPRFFELLRIRHVAGRPFTATDRPGAPAVALVNEAFARQFYGGVHEALGRQVVIHPMTKDIRDPVREVVGVVADTTGWTLGDAPRPIMYAPLAQVDAGLLRSVHAFFAPRWMVKTNGDLSAARSALESVMSDLDPTQPLIDLRTLDSLMLGSIGLQRFYLVVLLAFAVFALGLSTVGIYAAYSYAVASRRQEIGVRLALGAAPGRILRGIIVQSLLVGTIAIAVGLIGAAAASRVLDTILFNVTSRDPATYAIVAATLLTTVLLAALIPALRASRVDPLTAIRQ